MKVTFDNLIDQYQENTPLCCRIKYMSALIYELISDCTSFEAGMNVTDKFFIKKKTKKIAGKDQEEHDRCVIVTLEAEQHYGQHKLILSQKECQHLIRKSVSILSHQTAPDYSHSSNSKCQPRQLPSKEYCICLHIMPSGSLTSQTMPNL